MLLEKTSVCKDTVVPHVSKKDVGTLVNITQLSIHSDPKGQLQLCTMQNGGEGLRPPMNQYDCITPPPAAALLSSAQTELAQSCGEMSAIFSSHNYT